MGIVHINKLKPQMVLADEVRDIDGRLLLEKGKTIESNHIKIFKIWGVTSVNIFDNDGDKEETRPDFDPEQYEKIKASTRKLFRFNDLEHPAIKEIFRQSVRFRNEYNYSNECLNSRLPDNDTAKIANQTNGIKRIFESNITLPEVPSIVFELNDVISNPFSSSNDIAQIIKKSPSLTALLLKFANSPFYGFSSRIDEISLAVTLVGTRELSALALGLSILSIFDKIPKKFLDMFSFLKHSFACGIISRMLASHKGITQTEQFFVSGLLHDLGRLILYCNFSEDSNNVLSISRTTDKLLYEVERDYYGLNHTHVAKLLIKRWKLPISLEHNVFYHHDPAKSPQPVSATLVHLADIIANGLGIGTSGERFVPPLDITAWESLELSPACFEIVIKQTTHQIQALDSMLEH